VANPYFEMNVRTADPLQLVVQMYDGAIRFVHQARALHREGQVRARGEALSRALAIVHELRASLDLSHGAAAAPGLEALYLFVGEQLVDANLAGGDDRFAAVLSVLEPLREAWLQIARGEVDEGGAG